MTGDMDAVSEAAVIDRLQAQGYLPVRADVAGRPALGGRLNWPSGGGGEHHWGVIAHQLACLLESGMALDRALALAIEVSGDKRVRNQLEQVLTRVQSGAALSEGLTALGSSLPRAFISMVRAGEASGALDAALYRIAELSERSQAIRETLRSALTYPLILVVVTVLSLGFILTVVLPQFKPLFEQAGDALPGSARLLLDLSELLNAYGWMLACGVAMAGVAVAHWLKTPAIRFQRDRLALRLPVVGRLIGRLETTRFARTLGLLLANGIPLAVALPLARGSIQNGAIGATVDAAARRVTEGQSLSVTLAEGKVFHPFTLHFIRIGEESGNLEAMLIKLADINEREARQSIKGLIDLLVPALTIILGIAIGGIVATVLSAILSVNEIAF